MTSNLGALANFLVVGCALPLLVSCSGGILDTTSSGSTKGFHEAYSFNGTNSSVRLTGTSQGFSVLTVEFFFQTTAAASQYLFSTNYATVYILMSATGLVGMDTPNGAGCTGNFGVQNAPSPYNDGKVHYLAAIFTQFTPDGSTLDLFHFDSTTSYDYFTGGGTYSVSNVASVQSPAR